ncbi:transcription initiation factor TFIID subunit 12 isoform X2 [Oryza sativa Japonica Group]|uniref:transcription initiation factor TFIID subunit 12 isoform X2 n=1 Tax=Oryza sativa subsp. japonica TaxID=39947 RepID=UPI00339CEC6B
MDAPPPAQPDAAAAAPAAPPTSTSASAPSSAPQPNPTPSASTAAPPTPDTTLAPAPNPTPAPVQTLETPAPSPASARPPVPRMRPPYTHLASPITMSSSPATGAASSSSASAPAATSASSSAMPRGGVALGLPAHPRAPQTPVGYTGFVPPPTLAAQFGSMHRGPDQPPPSSTQKTPIQALARPPSMASSPSMPLQQTPPNVSAPLRPPQHRPHPRPYHAPAISHPQNALLTQQQQKLPQHQHLQQQQQQQQQQQKLQQQQQQQQQKLQQQQQQQQQKLQQQQQQQQNQPQHSSQQSQQTTTLRNQQQISQQQTARTPVSMAQKLDSPAVLKATNVQSGDMASVDVDAGGSGNRLLSKRSIHELVAQIDPSEKLDPEVEDVLIDIAEDFVESVATFACSLAKHRKSSILEAKDVLLHAERSWNITLPGFSGDEIKLYKKPHVNDIHRERLTLIKKSMASESNAKGSAAQAAANQKNQTPKPPATGSP